MLDHISLSGHSWANVGSFKQQYIRDIRGVVTTRQKHTYIRSLNHLSSGLRIE